MVPLEQMKEKRRNICYVSVEKESSYRENEENIWN